MPIEFKCKCGKRLRAPDGTQGKHTTCPVCLRKQVIPGMPGAASGEPEASPSSSGEHFPCPNCRQGLPPNAVVCVNCGFNVKTGALARLAQRLKRACPRVALPIRQVLAGAAAVAVLGVGWFCLGAPMLAKLSMNTVTGYVVEGDLERALTEFEALRPKVGPEDEKRIDLWLAQLTLELEYNSGEALSKGEAVPSGALDIVVTPKANSAGGLLFAVKITNFGVTPLRPSSDFFYLRGLSDIVLVAKHTENSIDRLVIPPDGSAEGVIAFRKVPDHPVLVQRGRQHEATYYLIFNNGEAYVKCMLPF